MRYDKWYSWIKPTLEQKPWNVSGHVLWAIVRHDKSWGGSPPKGHITSLGPPRAENRVSQYLQIFGTSEILVKERNIDSFQIVSLALTGFSKLWIWRVRVNSSTFRRCCERCLGKKGTSNLRLPRSPAVLSGHSWALPLRGIYCSLPSAGPGGEKKNGQKEDRTSRTSRTMIA